MKMKNLVLAALFWAFQAYATGGWVSGGGNVLRDANNPWFLRNTRQVNYCILQDPKHFGDLSTPAKILVAKAIDYWKTQLSDPFAGTDAYPISRNPKEPYLSIEVGTQKFVYREACEGSEDITFQFGILTKEQRDYFGDRSRLIGAAVRTRYDEANLLGKGFIYIAADSGRNGYHGDHLHPRAWHEGIGGLLFRELAHELGHVFGLAHGGESLMSDAYSEAILREKSYRQDLAESLELPSFFHFELSPLLIEQRLGSEACEGDFGRRLFGASFDCDARLENNGQGGFTLVERGGKSRLATGTKIGSFQGTTTLRMPGHGFGVKVSLTSKQTVFSKVTDDFVNLRGPGVHSGRFVGKFTPALPGGKAFDAILILHPEFATLDGIIDGKYTPNIFTWSFSALGPE